MKTILFIVMMVSVIIPTFISGEENTSPVPAVAFVNVNVIPMDSERVLENQTVLVKEGVIAQIGAADEVSVPGDALRIEGRGKYLLPGLAEMHGHLPPPNASPEEVENSLFLYVANGVTLVRGMFGFPNHVELREKVTRGEILGPTLIVASPAMGGFSVAGAEDAEQKVRQFKEAGFDLIKVHEGLSPEAYRAIASTAKEVGIPFAGHVSDHISLYDALNAGQSTIDHLDNYIEAIEADDSPIKNGDPQTRSQKLIYHIDESKIPRTVAATVKSGVWMVPTMSLWEVFYGKENLQTLRQRPELKYVPAFFELQWSQQSEPILQGNPDPEGNRRVLAARSKILKALSDGGAKIVLGSDSPQLFSVPGFSIHREMQAMVAVGMTPYQVLVTGTRNVAEYFAKTGEFGTVAAGKEANLILANDNPLKDITHLQDRAGIMVRGRWMPQSEIQERLDKLAATNRGEENEVKRILEKELAEAVRIHNQILNKEAGAPDLSPNAANLLSARLDQQFSSMVLKDGADKAVQMFRQIRKENPAAVVFSEFSVNGLGYLLLSQERVADAIAVFKLNVEAHPNSFNVYDSLGEAYMRNGDKELAIKNYQKSLELNPDNQNGREMLKRLGNM
jgi:imidazolonepropionase-like amidohydrolase